MNVRNSFICGSLAVLMSLVLGGADADMRAGKKGGYAGSSKNLLALQQQYQNYLAETEAAAAAAAAQEEHDRAFGVEVADKELEEKIRDGDEAAGITRNTLDSCAMIYPNGEFMWDRPTVGSKANGPATCVAVVELRFKDKNLDSMGNKSDLPVARVKLAAGDGFVCNISNFPQSSYLQDIKREDVEFPADAEPTREDVIKVMNQEQKQKAGLKILGGLVVGGLGGNLTGKNDPGKDGMLGTSKSKLKNAAIGAAGGAALMAASSYSGKVAGDIIMNTGINAIAGGLVGNMSATGDDVLRVEKCKTEDGVETTCLWGKIENTSDLSEEEKNDTIFYGINSKKIVVCKESSSGGEYTECKENASYVAKDIKETAHSITDLNGKNSSELLKSVTRYEFQPVDNDPNKKEKKMAEVMNAEYVIVDAVKRNGSAKKAVVLGFTEKALGSKMDDWYEWVGVNDGATVCLRDNDGNPYNCSDTDSSMGDALENFTPVMLGADSEDIIDMSNKARLGSTLKGAGVGGAVGGFSGYQGAQNDIDERWVQAKTEYRGSLMQVYCGTGNKYLGFYNDEVLIPTLQE